MAKHKGEASAGLHFCFCCGITCLWAEQRDTMAIRALD